MSDDSTPKIGASASGLWTRACQGDTQCLKELASRFWLPAYVWLRALGVSAPSAPAHCSDFFTWLAGAGTPSRDDPATVRFREFILAQLRVFMAAGFPSAAGTVFVPVDSEKGERYFADEPQKSEDEIFDRRWAMQILEIAMRAARADFEATGKIALFNAIKPFLAFSPDAQGYAETAKTLSMSASAFHMQVFDFRKKYRMLLRGQIADTVRHPDDVDSELTVLLVAAS